MIGDIKTFAGEASALPSHCLPCDGRALSRITYADLFSIIGTLWGSGDGSTTFNIPDLRDKFVRGSGVSRSVGSSQSEQNLSHNHSLTINQYSNNSGLSGEHSHGVPAQAGYPNPSISRFSYASGYASSEIVFTSLASSHSHNISHSHSADCANSGGSELRPNNIAILYYIEVFNESSSGSSGLTEEQANMLQTVYDFITANCKRNQDGSYDFTKIFPVPSQGASPYYLSDHFNYLICKLNGEY